MRRSAAVLLFVASAAAQRLPDGVASYDTALSQSAAAVIEKALAGLSVTATGRRLLAETSDVPMREASTGLPVSYRRRPVALLFDAKAIAAAGAADFQLHYVRELRRSELALPVAVPEEEMAARQDELAFAVEKAQEDKAFTAELKSAAPGSEAQGVSREAALFAESPERFYRHVETGLPDDVRQAALPLVEDLLKARGRSLPAAVPEDAPYAVIEGERYPAALARAALLLGPDNGLARAREALADFDGRGARELRERIRRWLGRVPLKTQEGR